MSTNRELSKKLREAKKEIKDIRAENHKLRRKLQIANEWIEKKFNWWIDLLAENKAPCLRWMIKNTKDIMLKTKED